jgi:hypothetical protein
MHAIAPDTPPTVGHVSDIAQDASRGHHASLEVRVSRLETAMEYIRDDIRNLRLELRDTRNELRAEIRELRTDFRFLFGTVITFGLGLSGMMAKGFHWI